MYTLTRKLAMICLAVVLSVLAYGCGGGSSQQTLISDVSTDMVTAGLTPDPGTYTIQPGGTANAGDVAFPCPAEGASCEVTVADDGTVTSAGGMAMAITSASAAARLAAVAEAEASEAARVAAVAEAEASEAARVAAVAAAEASEAARVAAVAAAEASEAARVAAVAAANASEEDRVAAVAEAEASEAARVAAVAEAEASEAARVAAVAEATAAEAARVAAVAEAETSEAARVAAVADRDAKVAAAEADRDAKVAAAEAARDVAVTEAMTAETDRDTKVAAAELDRDTAVAAAELDRDTKVAAAEADRDTKVAAANAERDTAVTEAMTAETDRDAKVAAAELDRDTKVAAANAEKDTAVAAAELDRDTKVAAAELDRDTKVAAAELDRDTKVAAANADRDDAVAALILANLRADPHDVDLDDLLPNYMTMTAGTHTIQPGDNMDVDDVNFTCPRSGRACEVVVDEDGTVTSAGGMATAQNSMAAMTTRTAKALYETDGGALNIPSTNGPKFVVNSDDEQPDSVTRSLNSVATIKLAHTDDSDETTPNEYTSEAVDTGHEINGWMGLTLKRDDSMAARTNVEAEPASFMDEVTIYTNIDEAKPGKFKVDAVILIADYRVGVDADQTYSRDEGDTFEAILISPTEATKIPGTFTCDIDNGCPAIGGTERFLGASVLAANPLLGWEFESDENVKEGEKSDSDYMYFGYWLQSPVDGPTTHAFATYSGGNQEFGIDPLLIDDMHALTATYEGGAAGRYVTRELRIKDGASVDEFSRGFHGRFTANAVLKAYFGEHADFLGEEGVIPNRQNRVEGTISKFMDGDTELGFKVTLGLALIGENGDMDGTASAMFGRTGDNMSTSGTWEAQFFGSSPKDDMDAIDSVKNRKLPSGIAGIFDVESSYTKIVGAFGAEK